MKLGLYAGHSGTAFGHYRTPGKRSPQIPPGFYEGEMNRDICETLAFVNSDMCFLNPGPLPISLNDKVDYANWLTRRLKGDLMLLEVHCNAAGNGEKWHSANGFTVFIHPMASRASERFAEELRSNFKAMTSLRDRGIRRVNYKILRVDCPAVLIECGFMTNRDDVRYLTEQHGHAECAAAINQSWDIINGDTK